MQCIRNCLPYPIEFLFTHTPETVRMEGVRLTSWNLMNENNFFLISYFPIFNKICCCCCCCKYFYMECLKMAHLGRLTYCFETLLFLCKLVFFNYNFHKNIRSRLKRFLSKQGQPRPHTQLKARLLTEQLKNGLFLRLHYSVHYYRLAILPIVILTLFVKYVFPSQICAIPL